MAQPTYQILSFDALNDWAADDHQAALGVFLTSCGALAGPDWQSVANTARSARDFFEAQFDPVLIDDGQRMKFTGYFEPELSGSRDQQGSYCHPIYALPPDILPDHPYLTRREVEESNTLHGLEIAWLADPVDLFFLQVQGSGRIRLPDNRVMRVGYAGKNGHPYTSVGKVLVERGILTAQNVSAAAIRDWVAAHPDEGRALLWENQSYVFFREISEIPADLGPLGALGVSITPGRSIAVDPAFTPLGAPVWIEKRGALPMNRLMIAQDTGSAIKGAQRADIFYGTANDAGDIAGQVNDGGRMIVLLPKTVARGKA